MSVRWMLVVITDDSEVTLLRSSALGGKTHAVGYR